MNPAGSHPQKKGRGRGKRKGIRVPTRPHKFVQARGTVEHKQVKERHLQKRMQEGTLSTTKAILCKHVQLRTSYSGTRKDGKSYFVHVKGTQRLVTKTTIFYKGSPAGGQRLSHHESIMHSVDSLVNQLSSFANRTVSTQQPRTSRSIADSRPEAQDASGVTRT